MTHDWAHTATGGPTLSRDEREDLERVIGGVPNWWHSIELAPGVVTPGVRPLSWFAAQWEGFGLGDLSGRTVLDVGAWDGFYAFAAEQAGAKRVVALDLPAWIGDHRADPETPGDATRELPGRRGFDLARAALDSAVEPVVADLMDVGPDELGTFDVVLFLGVLYHLEDPLGGLRRVASLTDGIAVIETAAMVVPGHERSPLWRFYDDAALNGDPTNWWVPNEAAVHALCAAAGFTRVETIASPRPEAPVLGEMIGVGRMTCIATA